MLLQILKSEGCPEFAEALGDGLHDSFYIQCI